MRVGDRKMEIKEIKRFMKEKKITQKELSLMSNVPLQTIKYILTERTTNPCIDTMQGNKKSPRRNRGRKFRKFYCTQRGRKKIALCLQPIERGDERAFNCARRKCRPRSERKAKSGVI